MTLNRSVIGAEGSAGPEGGREAPALGGGSGAARRCRAVIALLFAATPMSVAASETPLASVGETCGNASTISDEDFAGLIAAGWRTSGGLTKAHQRLLADGILAAMGTDRNTPLDWVATRVSADQLAERLAIAANTNDHVRAFIYDTEQAATLIAIYETQDNMAAVRCIYGGFSEPGIDKLLNTIDGMDEKAGMSQSTQGLSIFDVDALNFVNGKPVTVATRYGRIDPALVPETVARPDADLGISIIRSTEK